MTPEYLWLLALVAGALLFFLAKGGKGELSRLKVRPRPLMTRPERRVCFMIEDAMPGCRVHAQVSMGALMNPAKGLDKSQWWTTFNKFSSKRVDFAVEDKRSGQIVCLVELDDRSHNASADRDRDSMTAHAGYTTVRLPAGERHSAQSVAAHIQTALGALPTSLPPLAMRAAKT